MNRRDFLTKIAAVGAFISTDLTYARTDVLGTSRTLSVGTAGGLQVGLKSYPQTLELNDKELILTFDDGPIAGSTTKVLDILAAQNVRATFFLIGRNAANNPDLVKRMTAEGHTIATHSQTHPMTLPDMNETSAKANMEAGFASVTKALGNSGTLSPFFRYPGFGDSAALNSWLSSKNIGVFGTDIWASDWINMSPEAQLNLLMRRIRIARKGIVLLHDPRLQTANMLADFLHALKQEGYKIVHMVAGSGTVPLQRASAGWSSETNRFLGTRKEWPRSLTPKTGNMIDE
jgi:peptidoglycan-N-acetylglucosamine deacetylase